MSDWQSRRTATLAAMNAVAAAAPVEPPADVALVQPLPELRAWLTAAEEMLDRQMDPSDPRYAPGLAETQRRHVIYIARVLTEGEPV